MQIHSRPIRSRWLVAAPICLALLLAGCSPRTDRESYRSGESGTSRFVNALAAPVYLAGCSHFYYEKLVGDEFDLRDVPFVQYFTEGYALHAAYWHDDFGTPRSHGCVNLAPVDAAWLFGWTTPDVPEGWHAALTLKKGTIVYTHP